MRVSQLLLEKHMFDNKSVMCEGLKIFYGHVVKRMVENGIDQQTIARHLF